MADRLDLLNGEEVFQIAFFDSNKEHKPDQWQFFNSFSEVGKNSFFDTNLDGNADRGGYYDSNGEAVRALIDDSFDDVSNQEK